MRDGFAPCPGSERDMTSVTAVGMILEASSLSTGRSYETELVETEAKDRRVELNVA